jgi:hypothetical protein
MQRLLHAEEHSVLEAHRDLSSVLGVGHFAQAVDNGKSFVTKPIRNGRVLLRSSTNFSWLYLKDLFSYK